ncbi:MAG: class I SAM-dependent methyltransferase [candidate division KSB1 bacterium]|nr:class I SAM-dependent methyltransferase [candidate division KSB1 bacterium]MDZ7305174.1 class I SAM-dependent methyltransferase [candidate division KSB1 bacterium]MDZ7314276.1 class I SAM-dependent methyltransferase [candidate division KSB1 bacterium]
MIAKKNAQANAEFLDMQAEVGVTKHIGGFEATNELLSLCHIEDAREVLNVGCGVGVGSTYIAKKYGCHVVGVDISEKMIEWSRRRAREEKVEAKVEFRTADVLDLPFAAGRFDVVFAESVLIFVEDKAQAIRECVRVTKPGGYVGLNEGFWTERPPPDLVALAKEAVGPCVPTIEDWRALWEASGLRELVVQTHQIDASKEVKGRIEWIGWRWLLRAWGRALRLYITNPAIRQSIKKTFAVPPEVFQYLGYGLFVGKKSEC